MPDILRGGIVINEILVDPNGRENFDTDGNGLAEGIDEYVELYNTSSSTVDLSGLELWDRGVGKWFTFPAGSELAPGAHALVLSGVRPQGSLPTGEPGDLFFDADRLTPVMNNGGDNVTLYDPDANTFVQATFNGDALDDPTGPGYFGFPSSATRVGEGENFGNDIDGRSVQREPDGADSFVTGAPSPGVANLCFANGTRLDGAKGDVLAEDVRIGTLLRTVDNGLKPVRWILSKTWTAAEILAEPKRAPIRICKGAFGSGLPSTDLRVSRQHRVLVRGPVAQRMFGTAEVLVPAVSLLRVPGVSVCTPPEGVTYFHIMLDQHELLHANGVPAESFYLGPVALATIPLAAREEIEAILDICLDDLSIGEHPMLAARPLVEGKRATRLVKRIAKNDQPILSPLR